MTSTGMAAPPETRRRSDVASWPCGACSRGEHRGHAFEHGDLVALDDLKRLEGIEAGISVRQAPLVGRRRPCRLHAVSPWAGRSLLATRRSRFRRLGWWGATGR